MKNFYQVFRRNIKFIRLGFPVRSVSGHSVARVSSTAGQRTGYLAEVIPAIPVLGDASKTITNKQANKNPSQKAVVLTAVVLEGAAFVPGLLSLQMNHLKHFVKTTQHIISRTKTSSSTL